MTSSCRERQEGKEEEQGGLSLALSYHVLSCELRAGLIPASSIGKSWLSHTGSLVVCSGPESGSFFCRLAVILPAFVLLPWAGSFPHAVYLPSPSSATPSFHSTVAAGQAETWSWLSLPGVGSLLLTASHLLGLPGL